MQKEFYVEQLVKRKKTAKNYLIRVLAIAVAVALAATSWLISPQYCYIITAVAVVAAYFLYKAQNVEYEYTFFNGDFVVYRIIDQRKRTKLLSTNMAKVQVMAPCMPAYDHIRERFSFVRTVDYSESASASCRWFVVFSGSDTGKTVCAILQPSDRMYEAFSAYLKDKIRTEHGTTQVSQS